MEERRVELCMSQTNFSRFHSTHQIYFMLASIRGQHVAVEDVFDVFNILKTTALGVSISLPQLCHPNLETHSKRRGRSRSCPYLGPGPLQEVQARITRYSPPPPTTRAPLVRGQTNTCSHRIRTLDYVRDAPGVHDVVRIGYDPGRSAHINRDPTAEATKK